MTPGEKIVIKAMEYYGLSEIPGAPSNIEILLMLQEEVPAAEDDSKYGWCGVFAKRILSETGYKDSIPDKPAGARNWLNTKHVTEVELHEACLGDIVVFWRQSLTSWKGHVAFFINHDSGNYINVLGGNQSNQVNIRPYASSRILKVLRLEE